MKRLSSELRAEIEDLLRTSLSPSFLTPYNNAAGVSTQIDKILAGQDPSFLIAVAGYGFMKPYKVHLVNGMLTKVQGIKNENL